MSLAEATRAAARAHPFLLDALRAGVVNYTAAARFLDVGDPDAVAAALRRFAEDLDGYDHPGAASLQVRMERGFGSGGDAEPVLTVGDLTLAPNAGNLTAIVVRGDLDAKRFATILARLDAADVSVEAAGVGEDHGFVVVPGPAGPGALRAIDEPTD